MFFFISAQVPKAICILQALPALFLPFAYGHKKRGTFFLLLHEALETTCLPNKKSPRNTSRASLTYLLGKLVL